MSPDENEIRSIMSAWSKALEAKDLDTLISYYSPDIVLFDVKPPYVIKGIAAYRKVWEECLPYFPQKFTSEHRDVNIMIDGDMITIHCLHRIKPIDEEHPAGGTWLRVTACSRKIKGKWLIVHEHVSIPFDPMTGKVAYITDNDITI